jgi:hypothetical protein
VDFDSQAILQSLGPAQKFADPAAPKEARLMAASGALPLPPPQIASVLFALTFDPDAEVKERAMQSLGELPERVIEPALEAELHPGLLAFFAERFREDPARSEKLALNPATSDETYCLLASLPHPRVVEIVSHNQTRLLRCSDLVDALAENPLTRQATIDRVLQFLGLKVDNPAMSEVQNVPEAPQPLEHTAPPDSEVFDSEDTGGLPEELLIEDENDESRSREEEEEKQLSLSALIQTMTVMEKIKLARFGNSEARGLLARDRNRIVSSAAIRSPKITENEVISFAKSRSLSEEVMRIIASSREWTKNYQVKHALATNPRTPIPAAIKFLNYLNDKDLKQIMRSRDVPAPITVQAKRILARKGKI